MYAAGLGLRSGAASATTVATVLYGVPLRREAKRKYFEHAGTLMTADASGDKLLKFEGVHKGTEFNFYR